MAVIDVVLVVHRYRPCFPLSSFLVVVVVVVGAVFAVVLAVRFRCLCRPLILALLLFLNNSNGRRYSKSREDARFNIHT